MSASPEETRSDFPDPTRGNSTYTQKPRYQRLLRIVNGGSTSPLTVENSLQAVTEQQNSSSTPARLPAHAHQSSENGARL